MVFVSPAVRIARHRRMAVSLRRQLDALFLPSGFRYATTEIAKEHVRIAYARDDDQLVVSESDHHDVSGAYYLLSCNGKQQRYTGEAELADAARLLVASILTD